MKNEAEVINLLEQLIALKSYEVRGEGQMLKFLEDLLNELKFRDVYKGENYIKASLGKAEKGIFLNCPIDTSPPGSLEKWKSDPFKMTQREGKIFGRGVADSKSGITAMIYSALQMSDQVDEEKFRIELVFDGGEHSGEFSGMKEAIKNGLDVNGGIIGYGGDREEIGIGCRGFFRHRFTTYGEAFHTGSREKSGENAIYSMMKIIDQLRTLELPKYDDLFSFGPRLTVSTINGGTAVNVNPDRCVITVDIRTLPDTNKEDIEELLDAMEADKTEEVISGGTKRKFINSNQGYKLNGESEIIFAVESIVNRVLERKSRLVAHGASHTGALLYKHDIPMVVYGPQSGNIHSYNEYVVTDSLLQTVEIYTEILKYYFSIN